MKKIIFLTFLILGALAYSQADPEFRSVSFAVDDATEMNSIPPGKLSNGKTVYRRDTRSVWIYDVDTWRNTGLGPDGIPSAINDNYVNSATLDGDTLRISGIENAGANVNLAPLTSTSVKVSPSSPNQDIELAHGLGADLDTIPEPVSGVLLTFPSDQVDVTPDAVLTEVTVTGVTTKTWTFKREGLPDIVVAVNDNGSQGTADGAITGATLSGTVLTLTGTGSAGASVDLAALQDGVGDGSETIINAGSNTLVTGSGTSGDPYVISSTSSGGGITDHGALTGLLDDDHPQYMTQTESDARYVQSEVDGSTTNEIQTLSKTGSTISLSNGGGSVIDTDTQLTNEQVSDYVGAMFSGNTETGITATYQDGDNTIDLVAADTSPTNELQTITKSGNIVTLSNGGGSFTDTDTDTQLTDEQVQDKVGAMVSGNNETGITVTYNDGTGKLDFSSSGITETSGSWSPTLIGGGNEVFFTYTALGEWFRHGDLVTFYIHIYNINDISGAATTSLKIANWPFSFSGKWILPVIVRGLSGDSSYRLFAEFSTGNGSAAIINQTSFVPNVDGTLDNASFTNGELILSGTIKI